MLAARIVVPDCALLMLPGHSGTSAAGKGGEVLRFLRRGTGETEGLSLSGGRERRALGVRPRGVPEKAANCS